MIEILLMVFFVFGSIQILFSYKEMDRSLDTVQIYLADSIDAATARQIVFEYSGKDSIPEFVLWSKKMMQKITSTDLAGKSMEAEVIALCGKSALLFDSSIILDYTDEYRCLLSNAAAQKLFGTEDVIGLSLEYQGDMYRIIGLIPSDEIYMAYEMQAEDTGQMTFVSIGNRERKSQVFLQEKFSMITGAGRVVDYEWMVFLLRGCVFWVHILILLCLTLHIAGVFTVRDKEQTFHMSVCICICIIAVFSVIVMVKSVYIPVDYLVDFGNREFWSSFLVQKVQAVKDFFLIEKGIWEFHIIHAFIKSVLCVIAQLSSLLIIKSITIIDQNYDKEEIR